MNTPSIGGGNKGQSSDMATASMDKINTTIDTTTPLPEKRPSGMGNISQSDALSLIDKLPIGKK
jgi:hypothetical protein